MSDKRERFDLVIIGGGPGGLSAAIYAARAELSVLIIGDMPGGKLSNTARVDNYPGTPEVSGAKLAQIMYAQAIEQKAQFVFGRVDSIEKKDNHFILSSNGKTFEGKAVIVATGLVSRKLNVPGEKEFEHKGVSECIVCDGAFYKDSEVVVIGGGNSAVEEALFSVPTIKKIHILSIGELTAELVTIHKIMKFDNVNIIKHAEIKEILGDEKVHSIRYEKDGKEEILKVDAVFPYIGYLPQSNFISDDLVDKNEQGFIKTNKEFETKTPNLFAIGDITENDVKQITTAVSSGTIAAKLIISRSGNI